MKGMTDKHSYLSYAIGILIVLMALTDVLQTKVLLIGCALLSVLIFIFCFPIANKKFYSKAMILIVFIIITSLMNLFFTKNNFGGSLTLMGNLFLSFLYIQYDSKKLTFWIVLSYLITILFISYHLFILGTHENFIYQGLSRNHAGFAVVFWSIFLLFHLKVNYNIFPIAIPLFGLILSFFLVGRTSLIVTALLFLTVFFYKFKNNRSVRIIALLLFMGVCYFLWLRYGLDLLTETNLDAGLDTPRWKLWQTYWEHLDFGSVFSGVDVTKLPMYNEYSGNPHNSFIKFHSRTGFGSIVFIVLLLFSFLKYVQLKENYLFWLLSLLTMRAMFDGDILIGNFDFIFLILTFYWIKRN